MSAEIWIYADFTDPRHLGLLSEGLTLARAGGLTLAAVCAGPQPGDVFFEQYEANKVYRLPPGDDLNQQALIFSALCQSCQPEIVLLPATVRYSTIAARTAALLGTGLTADCTGLELKAGHVLHQHRPAYGGGLLAEIVCAHHRPQMATLRVGAFSAGEPAPFTAGNLSSIIYTPPAPVPQWGQLIAREVIPARKDLREARIIVAGGKGVGSRQGFALLAALAERLGGLLGASRSAVDAGFADYDQQIGQTGLVVSPDLYLAFGISGAPQHIAGIQGAGKIIAINADPRAPIFDYADLAIVSDWRELAEGLLQGA